MSQAAELNKYESKQLTIPSVKQNNSQEFSVSDETPRGGCGGDVLCGGTGLYSK